MCISFGCDLNILRVILSYMEKTKLPGSYFLLLGAGLLALMILVVSNDSQVGVKADEAANIRCSQTLPPNCGSVDVTNDGRFGDQWRCVEISGKCGVTGPKGSNAGGDPSDETEDDTSAPGRSCCLGAGMMGVRDDSGACVPKAPCDTTSCGPAGCTANPASGNGNGTGGNGTNTNPNALLLPPCWPDSGTVISQRSCTDGEVGIIYTFQCKDGSKKDSGCSTANN